MSDTSGWTSPALLIAIVAAGAAWLNYKKLKLDLFEKRYEAYRDTLKFALDWHGEITRDPLHEDVGKAAKAFWTSGQKLEFLYGADVASEYSQLRIAIAEYATAIVELRHQHEDPKQRTLAALKAQDKGIENFRRLDKLSESCVPYLRQYSLFWHRPDQFFLWIYTDITRWVKMMVEGGKRLRNHILRKLKP